MELVETVQVKCKYLIRIVKIEKKKKKKIMQQNIFKREERLNYNPRRGN